ncbi:hypothetical protein T01_6645 [Trichinella spiralis]|uniref:Uncharacterized protein n=1 Tax=Trichinella spiralis TaxID=6334 RepID=A0A0V1C0S1_TRISP|nr:hypothetical protein T01_6645 [Trichinella spiralis]
MEVKNMNNSKRAVQIDSQQSRRAGRHKENNHKLIFKLYCDSGRDRLDSNEVMVTRSDRSFVCDNHTSLDRTLALVSYWDYCTSRFQQPPPRWTKSINPLLVPATPANAPTWLPGREPFGAWLIEPYHRVNKTAPRFLRWGFIAAVRRLPQLDLQLATPPYSNGCYTTAPFIMSTSRARPSGHAAASRGAASAGRSEPLVSAFYPSSPSPGHRPPVDGRSSSTCHEH